MDGIYDDLDVEPLIDEEYKKVQTANTQLLDKIGLLEAEVQRLQEVIAAMKQKQSDLERNISSLYNTAIAECGRKDRLIDELRRKVDDVAFRRDANRRQSSHTSNVSISSTRKSSDRYDKYADRNTDRSSDRVGDVTKNRSIERNRERDRKSPSRHPTTSYQAERTDRGKSNNGEKDRDREKNRRRSPVKRSRDGDRYSPTSKKAKYEIDRHKSRDKYVSDYKKNNSDRLESKVIDQKEGKDKNNKNINVNNSKLDLNMVKKRDEPIRKTSENIVKDNVNSRDKQIFDKSKENAGDDQRKDQTHIECVQEIAKLSETSKEEKNTLKPITQQLNDRKSDKSIVQEIAKLPESTHEKKFLQHINQRLIDERSDKSHPEVVELPENFNKEKNIEPITSIPKPDVIENINIQQTDHLIQNAKNEIHIQELVKLPESLNEDKIKNTQFKTSRFEENIKEISEFIQLQNIPKFKDNPEVLEPVDGKEIIQSKMEMDFQGSGLSLELQNLIKEIPNLPQKALQNDEQESPKDMTMEISKSELPRLLPKKAPDSPLTFEGCLKNNLQETTFINTRPTNLNMLINNIPIGNLPNADKSSIFNNNISPIPKRNLTDAMNAENISNSTKVNATQCDEETGSTEAGRGILNLHSSNEKLGIGLDQTFIAISKDLNVSITSADSQNVSSSNKDEKVEGGNNTSGNSKARQRRRYIGRVRMTD